MKTSIGRWRCYWLVVSLMGYSLFAVAADGFEVISLGARGGIEDGNLSSFLLRPQNQSQYVVLDAGTLVNGLIQADKQGAFATIKVPDSTPQTRVGYILHQHIAGYLISHAHLDHIAGLIIASPDDNKKGIYALTSVNKLIEKNYFNWESWPNFANTGRGFTLNQYQYVNLIPQQPQPIAGTPMQVTAYPLSHAGTESTAFLVEHDGEGFLYFGDTGPDTVENCQHMQTIWRSVAEQAKTKALKGIIIEVSYTSQQPDNQLYGHLTPAWLLRSLKELETFAGGAGSLNGLPVIISHIKYSLNKGVSPQELILQELNSGNDMGVDFIIPEQGMSWYFN